MLANRSRSVDTPGHGHGPAHSPAHRHGHNPADEHGWLTAATAAVMLGAVVVRPAGIVGILVAAVIFIPLERVYALHPKRVLHAGWRTDVAHAAVNRVLSTVGLVAVIVAVGLALRAITPELLRRTVHALPLVLQFVVALLITELAFYWAHRASHRVPALWRFHKVHHSITEMDWLASARLHPIDQAFTRSCIALPLFALGFSASMFGAYLLFEGVQALFIHSNVRFTFGPLRYVAATPMFHHWHHADASETTTVNFGAQLPLMDAIFGTLHLPRHRWPTAYGIDEPTPTGYLRQLAWPFRGEAA